ncbi:hypothetical protein BT93_G1037 [Corymbia citriodora subsp. variegata]|nr:hypothetical protein BT93_G1037 [Corymbia citriodora subsp. variegata]
MQEAWRVLENLYANRSRALGDDFQGTTAIVRSIEDLTLHQ